MVSPSLRTAPACRIGVRRQPHERHERQRRRCDGGSARARVPGRVVPGIDAISTVTPAAVSARRCWVVTSSQQDVHLDGVAPSRGADGGTRAASCTERGIAVIAIGLRGRANGERPPVSCGTARARSFSTVASLAGTGLSEERGLLRSDERAKEAIARRRHRDIDAPILTPTERGRRFRSIANTDGCREDVQFKTH